MTLITARQQSCGKVMFSVVAVCLQGGFHVTIIHDALDTTVQGPPSPAPFHRDSPASDIWWLKLKTCSNLFHTQFNHTHLECWLVFVKSHENSLEVHKDPLCSDGYFLFLHGHYDQQILLLPVRVYLQMVF